MVGPEIHPSNTKSALTLGSRALWISVVAASAGCSVGLFGNGPSESSSCDTTETQSCAIEHGTGTQTRICDPTGWSPCVLVACADGYEANGAQCVPQTCGNGSVSSSCTCGTTVVSSGYCCGGALRSTECMRVRLDGGLTSGTSTFGGTVFLPLLPYLATGQAFDSNEGITGDYVIANTDYDALYQNETWVSTPEATFLIPVDNGNYTVHLHFVDWATGTHNSGDRLFHVDLQGARVLTNLDILAEAGGKAALVKSADITVEDNAVSLTLTNHTFYAEIAAIEILPQGEPHLPTTGPAANREPTVDAGADQTIQLPTTSVTLTGTASDPDGDALSYVWTQTAGAATAIESPASPSTQVTGLAAGSYVFELSVSDGKGGTAQDSVQVGVLASSGPAYYFSTTAGDDARTSIEAQNPVTPWKTLAKLNSVFGTLSPGDAVLFKRGDEFPGSIVISRSGVAGAPITLGAYGSGAQPIITGFVTVNAWTDLGSHVWESTNAISGLPFANVVLVGGVATAMGRYPNTGYLTYESCASNTSITSSSLDAASTNWTGAEAVIRKQDWILDRALITNHSGNLLTYTSYGSRDNAAAGNGFFIQNDPRTLDQQNEWYYDSQSGKIQVYSVGTPSKVQVSTVDTLLDIAGYDYITVDGLTFTGSNSNALSLSGSFCRVQSCTVSFSGRNGISIDSGNDNVIDGNTINRCNRTGIMSSGAATVTTNNTISNVGVVIGQAFDSEYADGIYTQGAGDVVQYNTIRNTAYNGIFLSYVGPTTIQYNLVDTVCTILDDGGGIYTSSSAAGQRLIDHNIFLNSLGNSDGTRDDYPLSEGIYLDEQTSGVIVTNNTVANSRNGGIKLHRAHENTIEGNVLFNNLIGIYFQNSASVATIYGNVMNQNVFFAQEAGQFALGFDSNTDDIPSFGTADDNCYARPIQDDYVFRTSQPSTGDVDRTLADWKTFTGQDAGSRSAPKTISDVSQLRFEYNATKTDRTITLDGSYVDTGGTAHSGTITLARYTSVILIRN